MLVLEAKNAVTEFRALMNEGRVDETNALVTDDFFAVFSLGKPDEFETYDASEYRWGNVEAHQYYAGKNPHWAYTDLSWGMRDDTEFIISSKIDFTLNGEHIMMALVTEVYRLDGRQWRLSRQYMEKFRPHSLEGNSQGSVESLSSRTTGDLHHIEINVSNMDRSIEFWGWLLGHLGYQPYQSWPEGQSWRNGDTYLVLVQTEQEHLDAGYHRKRTGLNHLAFHAGSREQVDELTRLLRTRGVSILYEDSHPFAGGPQHYAVFVEDPDRIKVEIVAQDEREGHDG